MRGPPVSVTVCDGHPVTTARYQVSELAPGSGIFAVVIIGYRNSRKIIATYDNPLSAATVAHALNTQLPYQRNR